MKTGEIPNPAHYMWQVFRDNVLDSDVTLELNPEQIIHLAFLGGVESAFRGLDAIVKNHDTLEALRLVKMLRELNVKIVEQLYPKYEHTFRKKEPNP